MNSKNFFFMGLNVGEHRQDGEEEEEEKSSKKQRNNSKKNSRFFIYFSYIFFLIIFGPILSKLNSSELCHFFEDVIITHFFSVDYCKFVVFVSLFVLFVLHSYSHHHHLLILLLLILLHLFVFFS